MHTYNLTRQFQFAHRPGRILGPRHKRPDDTAGLGRIGLVVSGNWSRVNAQPEKLGVLH